MKFLLRFFREKPDYKPIYCKHGQDNEYCLRCVKERRDVRLMYKEEGEKQ